MLNFARLPVFIVSACLAVGVASPVSAKNYGYYSKEDKEKIRAQNARTQAAMNESSRRNKAFQKERETNPSLRRAVGSGKDYTGPKHNIRR